MICCSRGRFSVEVAEGLEEKGMDAVSLEGGYIAWLLDAMKQEEEVDICKDVELSIRKKFRKSIWCKFTKAINQYELVKPGDRIAVCISGGKDSMLMAKLFQELERHGKKNFEVVFLVMNPGYNEINYETIVNNAKILNVPITVFTSEIFDSCDGGGGISVLSVRAHAQRASLQQGKGARLQQDCAGTSF